MRAWTVDADDIRVAEDFDEALLHRVLRSMVVAQDPVRDREQTIR